MRRLAVMLMMSLIIGCGTAPPLPALPPDPALFAALNQACAEEQLQSPQSYETDVDSARGIIVARWHLAHKGEIERRFEVLVAGTQYEVHAWQRKTGNFLFRIERSEKSKQQGEWIRERLERRMRGQHVPGDR